MLLPRRLLHDFHAVYAYCRWADDLGDETGPFAPELLAWWRSEVEACYLGQAWHPVFVSLRDTIERYSIPKEHLLNLLVAFEQDQHVKQYATFEQLLGYCVNSANPVGRLVLYLFESHDDERGKLSDSICTGLQLANFWQDVSRDLEIGRIYLPAEDRLRFGCATSDLEARRHTQAFAQLLEFEVERARDLLFKGYPLVDLVPSAVQTEIELFIQGGLSILAAIEKAGYDVLSRRPVVSKLQKGRLVLDALLGKLRRVVWPRAR